MVGTDHINSPVSEPLYHRIDIPLCAQRRVHFYIGIKVSSSDLFIRELKMVSANFRCDMNALRLGTANQLDSLRSEEHTSELQSRGQFVCRLLLEIKKKK